MKTYRFNDEEIQVEDNIDAKEVRNVWSAMYPALENADIVAMEDGSTEFKVRAGTKG